MVSTFLLLLSDADDVGRASGKSGQHPVSPVANLPGDAGSRARLDRPAAYPKAHPRRPIPWPFGEFYAAIRG